jgi:hypothetical protein
MFFSVIFFFLFFSPSPLKNHRIVCIANDVGRSTFRILTVRSYFKDAHSKLSNLPSGDENLPASLLSRIIWHNPALEHARSHLPVLVDQLLQSSTSFAKNVKAIADLYDENGDLKPESNHAKLGDSQTHNIPSSLRHPAPFQHLMFGSDDEDGEDDVDEYNDNESSSDDPYYTGYGSSTASSPISLSSSEDRLVPIVISSDEISSISSSTSSISRSKKNPKKRKRSK